MGVASSPGPQRGRPARRSIRFAFLAMVIVPVLALVLLWGLLAGFAASGAPARGGLFSPGHHGLAVAGALAGAGLLAILAAAVLIGFARRLRREISGVEVMARYLADTQLPQVMKSLRDEGGAADLDQGFQLPSPGIREIAGVSAAITSLSHAAVAAAADETRLRNGIAQVFVSLARRSQSLLQRQLHLIDTLEKKATDPAELADLFALDHLTTRMRRHAENLIILSGASPGRSWSAPVPVIDVIRGAMAEVEDYQRVRVLTKSQDAVTGSAVADMIHLLAELIENATLFSPSGTRVEVRAERVANGFIIEVEDRGLGIQPGMLSEINQKLAEPPGFGLADPDRLGLFVVSKLAARHGIRVSLNPSPYGGTKAVMLIPHSIVVPLPSARSALPAGEPQDAGPAVGEPAALGRPSQEAFALTAQHVPQPGAPADQDGRIWPAPVGAGTLASPPVPAGPLGPGTGPPASPPVPADAPGTRTPPGPLPAQSRPPGLPPPSPPGEQAAATYRGLPRRVRQASLSPHLAGGPAGTQPLPAQPGAALAGERTPERARDVVASFRSGWQRDLPADAPDGQAGGGKQVTGRQDSAAQHREEKEWTSGARPAPEQT